MSDFVRERRVLRAAELLRRTSQWVAEVALQCGFCDQAHLTHAFRRHAGLTPARFRALEPPSIGS